MQVEENYLPSSVQTEVTVLGAMLLDALAIQDATAKLHAYDFSLDSHQRIYAVMAAMTAAGQPVDLITVMDALAKRHQLDSIGGAAYLSFLTEGIPRNPNIESYVRIVLERSTARKGINLCQSALQRLQDGSEAAETILDELVRDATAERPADSMTAAEVLATALDVEVCTVIPTGIPALDEMLDGGVRTKQVTIIGAKPSAGKSALCRQIERSAAALGFGIHAHSIEVPKETWLLHHAAALSGVPHWKLRKRQDLEPTEYMYLKGWSDKISADWNYVIDDAGSVNIDTLIAKSRLSVMRRKTKLVTVDYMQLISADRKLSRHLQMSEIANRLKEFAKTYDVAVVALSQISRSGNPNDVPTVESLKESGDIEAAANVILLNYRPKDAVSGEYTGEDEIIVGKQRDGRVGKLDMFFDWKQLTFRSR